MFDKFGPSKYPFALTMNNYNAHSQDFTQFSQLQEFHAEKYFY